MEETKLTWAEDSLIIHSAIDSVKFNPDSNKSVEYQLPDNNNKGNEEKNQPLSDKTIDRKKNKIENENDAENKLEVLIEPKAVNLSQAYSLFNNGVAFIDARDEADYQIDHIENAINIPFDDFDNHKQKLERLPKDKPLVTYCAGTDCDLSILLGNLLFESGFKQVYVFFGGWVEWQNAGYPTEKAEEN